MKSRFSGHIRMKKSKGKTSICKFCGQFTGPTDDGKPACKAFPNGIPDSFWEGKADHTVPYDGDNGITFEPIGS